MVIVEYSVYYYDLSSSLKFTGKLYYSNNNKYCSFFKNNMRHRYYGPALFEEINKFWFFNNNVLGSYWQKFNKKYSQKEFIKDLNKQWLL